MTDQYFANVDKEELIPHLKSRTRNYYDFLEKSGVYQNMRRSYVAYYGGDLNNTNDVFNSAILSKSGKAGQITNLKVNNYRNLVKHAVALATANKPALTTVAANTDYKSQSQCILANSLLDYYFNINNLAEQARFATELSCITGEGWLHIPWNVDAGEIVTVENNKPIHAGDLDVTAHDSTDIIRDTKRKNTQNDWLIVKNEINKYDLASMYPDKAEEILNISSTCEFDDQDAFRLQITDNVEDSDSELITYFTFYHNKTPACKLGRITVYAGDIVLFDGDLPYSEMPLVAVMPDVLHRTNFGYSPFNDLIGIQQASDNLMSSVLSNNLTFGTQNLWMPAGTAVDVSNLEGGLRLIQSVQPPQPLQLTQSSPEAYQLINMLTGFQETLSGISSTVRGNPEANLKSGAALALVVAQSVQFGSVLEASYHKMIEKVGETIIRHIQDFADEPRLATIVGTAKRPLLKEFTGKDVSEIRRVQVQQANAMSKTVSGRLELATQISAMPPEQGARYMNIVNTGQLPDDMQLTPPLLVIKQENERLSQGMPVEVIFAENHMMHIKTHLDLVNSPEAKEDPTLVQTTLEHIQAHINAWKQADPAVLMLTGQQPYPQPMVPVPQGAMPNPEAVAGGLEPLPVQGSEEAQMPNMPNMPAEADANSAAAYEQSIANIQ